MEIFNENDEIYTIGCHNKEYHILHGIIQHVYKDTHTYAIKITDEPGGCMLSNFDNTFKTKKEAQQYKNKYEFSTKVETIKNNICTATDLYNIVKIHNEGCFIEFTEEARTAIKQIAEEKFGIILTL